MDKTYQYRIISSVGIMHLCEYEFCFSLFIIKSYYVGMYIKYAV